VHGWTKHGDGCEPRGLWRDGCLNGGVLLEDVGLHKELSEAQHLLREGDIGGKVLGGVRRRGRQPVHRPRTGVAADGGGSRSVEGGTIGIGAGGVGK